MKNIVVLAVAFMLLSSAAARCAENVAAKIPVTTASDEARKEFFEGLVLADNLETANSLVHFDKAIALDPSFATAYLNRANTSLTMKDFLENVNEAVSHKDATSEGERLMILATQAGAIAQFEQQRGYLEKLVTLYPNDERARLTFGTFFFGQQEYDSAIAQLSGQSASRINSPLPTTCSAMLTVKPENTKTRKRHSENIPSLSPERQIHMIPTRSFF